MSEIQFGIILLGTDGKEIDEREGVKMTLARACEIALDAPLEADKNEGLKPKLRRGRLIDEITAAAKDMKPLALEADDIALIKERVATVFTAASFVRRVCLLLDPATKE